MNVFFASCFVGGSHNFSWVDEPEPLGRKFLDAFFPEKARGKNQYKAVGRCPAIRDFTDNVFVVTSPYDYELTWDGVDVKTSLYDQEFFDNSVKVRNIDVGFMSLVIPHLIMFAEDSLVAEFIPAHFHDSEFSKKTIVLPGMYDIGQHFRRLECAFRFREHDTIKINRGDALYYVKFHTKNKINFKRFLYNAEFFALSQSAVSIRDGVLGVKPLEFYYEFFRKNKLKKAFLKLIKENLLT